MDKRFIKEYASYMLEQIKPCAAYEQARKRVEHAISMCHLGYISPIETMDIIHNIPAWCESVLTA